MKTIKVKVGKLRQMIKEESKLTEAISDVDFDKFQPKFEQFVEQLEKLSKKYGIALDCTGGVSFGNIKSISYSSDLSSGDLEAKVTWNE